MQIKLVLPIDIKPLHLPLLMYRPYFSNHNSMLLQSNLQDDYKVSFEDLSFDIDILVPIVTGLINVDPGGEC